MASKIDPAVDKELKAIRADLKRVLNYAEKTDAARVKDTDSLNARINDIAKAINARH